MKLTALRPILWSEQFHETIAFYTNILDFTLDEQNEEWGWASLHKDEVEIMISRPNDHIPFDKPAFTGSFYISTENVDALWQSLRDKTSVVYEIETFEWGMREFAIPDNNGYILQFGQNISITREPIRAN